MADAEDAGEKEDAKAAGELKGAAKAAPAADDTKGPVSEEPHDVAEIRRKAKNTLRAACTILSMEGLQDTTRLIVTFTSPFYDAHSDAARDLRSPEEGVAFYLGYAKGSWLEPVGVAARRLLDASWLAWIGFKTDYAAFPKGLKETEPWIVAEGELASNAGALVRCLAHRRALSSSWHSDSWPGLLALACSEDLDDVQRCVQVLRCDFRAWSKAKELAGASTFLRNLADQSPFNTTLMGELGLFAFATEDDAAVRETLRTVAMAVFRSWNQSKVVEDLHNVLRKKESRDTKNKTLSPPTIWDTARSSRILTQHRRHEQEADVDDPSLADAPKLPRGLYSASGHAWTIDGDAITGTRTWPTFTPSGAAALAAQRALVAHLHASDDWENAARSCFSLLLPAGSVMFQGDRSYLVLGNVGFLASLVWEVKKVVPKEGGSTLFVLDASALSLDHFGWVITLEPDEWSVVDVAPISPARHFLCRGRRLSPDMGIVWRQEGEPTTPLALSARSAFRNIGHPQLTKFLDLLGLPIQSPKNVAADVATLVRRAFPDMPQEELEAIVALRGAKPIGVRSSDIPAEVWDDIVEGEDDERKAAQDPARQ